MGPSQIYTILQDAESEWWQKVDPDIISSLQSEGLDPSMMMFSGEILFLILQLKSVVIFSGIPSELQKSFITSVLENTAFLKSFQTISLFTLSDKKRSPNFGLSGSLVLVNNSHPLRNTVVAKLLNETDELISEQDMATILDYPFSIPEDPEQYIEMLEVGYATANDVLLMSYGIPADKFIISKRHFDKYSSAVSSFMKLTLVIIPA